MLYMVHGEDEFRRSEWLTEIKQKVSLDESMAALNTVTLNGQKLTPEELEGACAASPFLADKRLVIVEGLATRAETKEGAGKGEGGESNRRETRRATEKRMAEYLASIPPTTDLVLTENKRISATNLFLQALKAAGGRVLEMQPPKADSYELREWVVARARHHNVQMGGDAVDQIVAFGGNNLRLLDVELAKLAAYADGKPVTSEDVYRLVSYAREANVFEAMDALGRRDTRQALRKLHDLLDDGEAAQYLLFMVARQVRMLMQAREALDRGIPAQSLADELGVHRFVAQKSAEQARNFSLPGLLTLHEQLVELDWAVKTGRLEVEAALDVFVASVGRR
jgi:DNA polymerase-3 subunit delta